MKIDFHFSAFAVASAGNRQVQGNQSEEAVFMAGMLIQS